jgi:tol-pal system protein YbgF
LVDTFSGPYIADVRPFLFVEEKMRVWGVILMAILLGGCLSPSQDQLRMQMDLEQMKRRLADLEIRQADVQSTDNRTGDQVQRQVAEALAGIDNLRVEIQSLNGRLDELNHNVGQDGGELQLMRDDLVLQIDSLSARLDQLEQLEQRVVQLEHAMPTQTAPPEVPPAETAEQLYQRALDKIRKEGRFAEGRQLLEQFVQKYPEHELFVNALYWQGEAYYGEKKYEQAILQFQDVVSKYKDHNKAPAALLKQALAFNALGDVQNARTTMQKLIQDYPAAEQVEAAQKFLNQ